jgi:2-polyprenyl-3-methyl-5-hydroxy-6-metoxy-1,4-benzoquinol methylase
VGSNDASMEAHLRHLLGRAPTFWHRIRYRLILGSIPVGAPVRVVDVGAGTGWFGEALVVDRPRARYAFIEQIADMRERLRGIHGSSADVGDGRDPFQPDDIVLVLDVLEHQADDGTFLADLAARMPEGCLFIATVPAFAFLWSAWDEALGHYRRYARADFTRLLEQYFELNEVSYLFPELVPAALLRKILWRGRRSVRFPRLPRRVEASIESVGMTTVRMRRWLPIGTSLFAVGVRRGAS